MKGEKIILVAFVVGLVIGAGGLWLFTRPMHGEFQRISDRADEYRRAAKDADRRLEAAQREAARQLERARVALDQAKQDNKYLRGQLESDSGAIGGIADATDVIEQLGERLERLAETVGTGSYPAAPE
jgi:cell division septum initiation protein DivIVA